MSAATRQPLAPLIDRLLEECNHAGINVVGQLPGDNQHFASWYRDTIVAMEAEVANQDGHPPMTPKDVALMCRCVLSAATLAEAIAIAADFCDIISPRGGRLSVSTNGQSARFTMDSMRTENNALTGLVDTVGLFAYLQLFSWLIARPLQLFQVSLACPKREEVAPLLGLFNTSVLTAAPVYSLEFDASQLRSINMRSPAELSSFLEGFPCHIYGTRSDTGIQEQVSSLIESAVYRHQEIPSLAELSSLLGLSQSTLRRRLREEQNSYRQIRENCLSRIAQELVVQGRWNNEHIAEQLGFSNTSAFRRAFGRWTGQTPSELLQQSKS